MRSGLKMILAAASAALLAQAPAPPASSPRPQAASPPPAQEDSPAAVYRALDQGRYLDAVDLARRLAFAGGAAPDRSSPAYSTWAQIHPFIGGTLDPAALEPGPYGGTLDPERAERFRRAELRDAVREIAARAVSTRVVILNEAHDSPRDRAFALEVARALRPLGYDLFAAEAFANAADPAEAERMMERLARDGFPRLRTGHYTRDPVFGDLIRQVLALGYRPYAYEETDHRRDGGPAEQIARREQAQAESLAALLRRNPGGKLLVLVGYAHATETPIPGYGSVNAWMAGRLKRMTGIDPLTVDQTLIEETNARHRAYRDLIAPRMRGRPAVPFLGGVPIRDGQYGSAVDLQVIHPPLRLVRGRPDWMRRIGRWPVAIPRRLLPARGRRLVQAFAAGEPADAVPLDQIVVEAGRPAPPLMLPRGAVRWAVQDPAAPGG